MNPVVKTIYCLMDNTPHPKPRTKPWFPDDVWGVLHALPDINGTPAHLVGANKTTCEWLMLRLDRWTKK